VVARAHEKNRNFSEAVSWYRKAADGGNAAAQYNLGVMYANGRGVSKNDAQAVAWFRKAAEQGLGASQDELESKKARDNKECLEWNDGCVNCTRGGCLNNIGIACQPKEITCTRRQEQ
jgi:TPR repeat protein